MKTLLITGFDPFGGEALNPSWEAVKLLPDVVGDYEIIKLQVPTVFGKAAELVISAADVMKPDAVIGVGQAGGIRGISIEYVGINLREARIADNEGNKPQNVPISEGAPTAYFSTFPAREIVSAVKASGTDAMLSFSAGTFVCNDLLYSLQHHYSGTDTIVGFIHVPYMKEQEKDNMPALPLQQIVEALKTAITELP